jgi:hypothetical protein
MHSIIRIKSTFHSEAVHVWNLEPYPFCQTPPSTKNLTYRTTILPYTSLLPYTSQRVSHPTSLAVVPRFLHLGLIVATVGTDFVIQYLLMGLVGSISPHQE